MLILSEISARFSTNLSIGYSAIKMALVDENIEVTTIERDIERYNIALENIKTLTYNLNSVKQELSILKKEIKK